MSDDTPRPRTNRPNELPFNEDINNDRSRVNDRHSHADDLEELPDGTEDAVIDMEAHNKRRDNTYSTSGDNHSPGIDTDMDSNAGKKQQQDPKKTGGSRGKSDWH